MQTSKTDEMDHGISKVFPQSIVCLGGCHVAIDEYVLHLMPGSATCPARPLLGPTECAQPVRLLLLRGREPGCEAHAVCATLIRM